MRYLTKNQIVRSNEATVREHGGNFMTPSNFLNEENLDYLLEAVEVEMFGAPLYPEISDKAAVYCHHIICNHIFTDGNKRTGLAAGLIFLNLNGFDLDQSVTNEFLTEFILRLASGQVPLDECRKWFADHTVEVERI